ncbi:MAG: isoprenylcysteine carboxylmethyltransferase family protein [Pseudomonadota bacterium]
MEPVNTSEPTNVSDRPSPVPWPPILLVAVLAGAVTLGFVVPLPWPGLDDWPARMIGLTIGAGGIALMIWAFITFRRHRTTVMPHEGATTLITDGPFRRFRNPIYLADVMIMLGLAELTKNIWFVIAAAAFVPLVTWLAILPEERHLRARFGKDFEDFRAKTRRWI